MSFLDSFFRVEVEYDEINRMYTVSGPLRLGPAYSKYNNFSKNAFTVAESSKCVFHEVFLPEVRTICFREKTSRNIYEI